jgi:phage tail-like protein
MSRYGITVYGTDYYGEAVTNTFDATPFTAVAITYSETYLSWRQPGGSWSEQRLVRSSTGIPQSITDGVVVIDELYGFTTSQQDFAPLSGQGGGPGTVSSDATIQWNTDSATTGNSTSFYDSGLTSGRWYYYALFCYDTEYQIWRLTGSAEVLLPIDYSYTQLLYDRLPQVFKVVDLSDLSSPPVDQTSFLFRFLDVFGHELNLIRTDIDSLLGLFDARTVSYGVLPELAAQVGIDFEPAIGSRAIRRLVQNATHLYGLKGTRDGIRELATIVTSWACGVAIGYNMALDDLDAGPVNGPGRWTGTGLVVGYLANRGALDGPVGSGVWSYTVTDPQAGVASVDCNQAGDDGFLRVQFAIPVQQGVGYTVSQYLRAAESPAGATGALQLTWLDKLGNVLPGGQVTGSGVTPTTTDWTARAVVAGSAPVGAVYLETVLVLSGCSEGQVFYGCGFQAEQTVSGSPRRWQCAREIIVILEPEAVNEIIYPSPNPAAGSAVPWKTNPSQSTWSSAISAAPNGDLGFEITNSGSAAATVVAYEGNGVNTSAIMTTVSPGDVLQLMVDGQGSAAVLGLRVAYFDRVGVPLAADLATYGPALTDDGWSSWAYSTTVPDDAAWVTLGVTATLPAGGSMWFRHVGLVDSPDPVDYFDGSVPTPTSDNLWEGAQYASRSDLYTNRTTVTFRLHQLLVDFLPFGRCYALALAQPPVTLYAPDTAIEGYQDNPGSPPTSYLVGSFATLQWSVGVDNGSNADIRWSVLDQVVGSDASLQWTDYVS